MSCLWRRLGAKDRRRIHHNGYHLDLTFITPRVIAMALPTSGKEETKRSLRPFSKFWRNPISDVVGFVHEHLEQKVDPATIDPNSLVRVFNLSGRPRSYDQFGLTNFQNYAFPDNDAPSLELLLQIVGDIDEFLRGDARRIVIIHCNAGRGRTGTIIASYLLKHSYDLKRARFSTSEGLSEGELFDTAQEALDYFAGRRSHKGKGVRSPTQLRYLHYFESLLQRQLAISPGEDPLDLRAIAIPKVDCLLHKIVIRPATLKLERDESWTAILKVYSSTQLIFDTIVIVKKGVQQLDVDINRLVRGDVRVIVYHRYHNRKGVSAAIFRRRLAGRGALFPLFTGNKRVEEQEEMLEKQLEPLVDQPSPHSQTPRGATRTSSSPTKDSIDVMLFHYGFHTAFLAQTEETQDWSSLEIIAGVAEIDSHFEGSIQGKKPFPPNFEIAFHMDVQPLPPTAD